MKQVVSIPLRRISLSDSRPTIPETVNALASSLGELGLIQPVTVRDAPVMDAGIVVPGYRVIAGNHRVAAARALGWEEIEAFVLVGEDRYAEEMREIDENLIRAELTASQRAYSIKRRKELWEQRHPEIQVGQLVPPEIGYKNPPKQEKSFAADTAERTGQSKKDINRHVSRAEALGDDLQEITGTSLDKGVELDALKGLSEYERKDLIRRAKAGEKVSARKPEPDAPDAVVMVLRQMDVFSMILANKSMTAQEMAAAFLDQFDSTDRDLVARFSDAIPVMEAIAYIVAETDFKAGK